ncbi:rhodanese-like domain-containing protein [Maricaulis sp.]|uniref:rhodanese-like domain-containing protein n=1 Tax=Maricaulis sp. TaxID=1486257 RepID=UPI002624689A|nr:rhodanese-like domain-containing protein [Maricaulis sp.]
MSEPRDFTPQEVKEGLDADRLILVDVREAGEYEAEHIPGAILNPLSSFDVSAIPEGEGKDVVLSCRSGGRSARAFAQAAAAGRTLAGHLGGGIMAWKAAGFETVRAEKQGSLAPWIVGGFVAVLVVLFLLTRG